MTVIIRSIIIYYYIHHYNYFKKLKVRQKCAQFSKSVMPYIHYQSAVFDLTDVFAY